MKYEGICPDCKEWTEVNNKENGCCDKGCLYEGSLITIDDVLNEDTE